MDNELIPLEQTGISLAVRGAEIPKDLTFDQAQNAVAILTRLGSTARWGLADVIATSAGRWGEKYAQLIDATQMSQGSLQNMLYVWRKFPTQDLRLHDVSFSHYTAVAVDYIDDETRHNILHQAEVDGLSREQVREIIKGYGPDIIMPKFSKEAFVNRIEHLLSWCVANDAPPKLLVAVKEMFADFKREDNWDF